MQRLSEFGQSSPRTYSQIVLAFPLAKDASASAIYKHLRISLTRVGKEFPLLASKVHLKQSRFGGEEAFLEPSSDNMSDDIPLWTGIGSTKYANLVARGFPAQEFIRPGMDLNGVFKLNEGPVPVSHVRVKLINGGLLLFLSVHHTAGDAYCLGLFAEAFAAATRREEIIGDYSPVLDLPKHEYIASETLLSSSKYCPEYDVLLNPNPGPSQPDILPGGVPTGEIPGASRIFAFKIDKVEKLRTTLRDIAGPVAGKPSAFEVLAALTWAHVTRARLRSEVGLTPPLGDAEGAKLFLTLDFRRRFHDETEYYFGNAIITVPTQASVETVQSACGEQNLEALQKLVAQVTRTFSDVGQDAVLRRETLFNRVGDYRRLVLAQDRRIPGQMQFNSWRYFGGNDIWRIPGVGSRKPTSVRRVQGAVSIGNALLLPLSSSSDVWEILVQLPQVSMDTLLKDDEWMSWVHRVIG